MENLFLFYVLKRTMNERQESLSYEKAGAELVKASRTRAHLFTDR